MKNKNGKKNILRSLILGLCLVAAMSMPAFASNHVSEMDIEAVIYEDGSMYITQIWEGDFSEGTENYIPMNAPDYLKIRDLKVTDINGTYETLDNWDIDASFEEKAEKCGINYTDTGYEICYGISQYGHNRYAIEYRLENAVAAYSDYDGVNFRFVNNEMNTVPTDATVKILLGDGTPITDKNARIWAFGFEGKVEFQDGQIVAYTEDHLYWENHITVMFALEKGILNPVRQEEGSFEEVKAEAFSGSDYQGEDIGEKSIDPSYLGGEEGYTEEPTTGEVLLGAGVGLAIPIGITAFFVRRSKKRRKKIALISEKYGYFRQVPNEGNVNGTYALGRFFDEVEDGAVLATGILKLIELGCLEPIIHEKAGFMGKVKEDVSLRILGSRSSQMNEFDEYLYTLFEGAAGGNGILEPKELERFAEKNDYLLRDYINKCYGEGERYLSIKRAMKRWDMPSRPDYLTPEGEKELGELLGFKNYLRDFSLIAERGVKEVPIWREMLSYAMLFGIADKVAEQLRELYPDLALEFEDYTRSIYTAYACKYMLYNSMREAEDAREQITRSDGDGGFASFGGGGGSIGGGSGGGSR